MQIQQISDDGTANPIVARLTVQTQNLVQCYDLPDDQKRQLFGVMYSDIQPKLLACFHIAEDMDNEVKQHQKKIDEVGLEFQAGGTAYTIPAVLNLQSHAETFLYQAKSVLRDLAKIFLILFSKDFGNAPRFDQVLSWSKATFGKADDLTKMLDTDQALWIKPLIDMRNAVEHPGGYSGTLRVENFTSVVKDSTVIVTEPQWYLNAEPKSPIARAMSVFVDNLLTLCEQTLILCLEKFKNGFPLAVEEIPESQRDPKCPIRYKMTIDGSKISLPSDIPGRSN